MQDFVDLSNSAADCLTKSTGALKEAAPTIVRIRAMSNEVTRKAGSQKNLAADMRDAVGAFQV